LLQRDEKGLNVLRERAGCASHDPDIYQFSVSRFILRVR